MKLEIELPRHAIGTKLTYSPNKNQSLEAEIVGYHVEHDTDTNQTLVSYRVEYIYSVNGQTMTATVPRSTIDRQLLERV